MGSRLSYRGKPGLGQSGSGLGCCWGPRFSFCFEGVLVYLKAGFGRDLAGLRGHALLELGGFWAQGQAAEGISGFQVGLTQVFWCGILAVEGSYEGVAGCRGGGGLYLSILRVKGFWGVVQALEFRVLSDRA